MARTRFLISEIPFDFEKVVEVVRRREAEGALSTMIVVAEGAHPRNGRAAARTNGNGEVKLGGIAEVVAHEVCTRTGKETRTCVLGYLQRGGAPTALILSGVLLLRHVKLEKEADRIEEAVRSVIRRRETTTPDLGGRATTSEFTDAVISALEP